MNILGKMDEAKLGIQLLTNLKPIMNEAIEIKHTPTHGKQELIQGNEKHFAIYREIFESEHDAEHFVKFCNRIYSLLSGQLPPIPILIVMFKSMLPIMQPKELKGKQSHGKPDIKKTDDGKFVVILKEAFTEKEDAQSHLDEATKIKSMKL